MLDYAFRREGFCVVSGGDLVSGVDIRDCHFPAGVFSGVIGGDPCQGALGAEQSCAREGTRARRFPT